MNIRAFIACCVLMVVPSIAARAGAAPACAIDHARYALDGDPTFTAGFRRIDKSRDVVSNLGFFVRSQRTGHSFWFFFDGGTARYINLVSTTDVTVSGWKVGGVSPLGDMHFLQADKAYRFSLDWPEHGQPAPAYILIPGLREALATHGQAGEKPPLGFFRLTGCARPGDFAY
jgi:hypothetical protein